jgi:hypothetical protein
MPAKRKRVKSEPTAAAAAVAAHAKTNKSSSSSSDDSPLRVTTKVVNKSEEANKRERERNPLVKILEGILTEYMQSSIKNAVLPDGFTEFVPTSTANTKTRFMLKNDATFQPLITEICKAKDTHVMLVGTGLCASYTLIMTDFPPLLLTDAQFKFLDSELDFVAIPERPGTAASAKKETRIAKDAAGHLKLIVITVGYEWA